MGESLLQEHRYVVHTHPDHFSVSFIRDDVIHGQGCPASEVFLWNISSKWYKCRKIQKCTLTLKWDKMIPSVSSQYETRLDSPSNNRDCTSLLSFFKSHCGRSAESPSTICDRRSGSNATMSQPRARRASSHSDFRSSIAARILSYVASSSVGRLSSAFLSSCLVAHRSSASS